MRLTSGLISACTLIGCFYCMSLLNVRCMVFGFKKSLVGALVAPSRPLEGTKTGHSDVPNAAKFELAFNLKRHRRQGHDFDD